MHTQKCFTSHLGLWAVKPDVFGAMLEQVKAGIIQPRAEVVRDGASGMPLYESDGGVALLHVDGVIMKQFGKYNDASSLHLRKSLRKAVADDKVESIVLRIDSPGGAVSGTMELADEIARANAAKPVYAAVEDLGASAAYWIAAATRRISVNKAGYVGSIGVYAVVYDSSKAYDMQGVKAHVISTGELKGARVEGTPVSDAALEEVQKHVNESNEFFLEAVAGGRGMKMAAVTKVAAGRMSNALRRWKTRLLTRASTRRRRNRASRRWRRRM